MGYHIYQNNSEFFISADKIPEVVKAIHKIGEDEVHYSWVDSTFVKTQDIVQIFKCWRWIIYQDKETQDIVDINFDGEKYGDEEVLFKTIAPFVKDNSFIEMTGEDDARWRWVFSKGKLLEIYPRVEWDMPE